MSCHSSSATWEDCELLVPFMARRAAAAVAMHTVKHLTISSLSHDITLTLRPLEGRRTPSSALPFNFGIILPISSGGAIICRLVEAFCAALLLGGLQELSVFTDLESWWRPQLWQEMLRPAKGVESVTVQGAAARHLVSSLRMDSRAGEPPDEPPSLLFPRLKTLALLGLGIHDETSETQLFYDELVGALAHRNLGAPLETLSFSQCNVQKKWMEKIQAVVPATTIVDMYYP